MHQLQTTCSLYRNAFEYFLFKSGVSINPKNNVFWGAFLKGSVNHPGNDEYIERTAAFSLTIRQSAQYLSGHQLIERGQHNEALLCVGRQREHCIPVTFCKAV